MEAFHAAVAAGADAVYVGGKQFSARQNAPNFTMEELEKVSAEGHTAGCRVYVALNTLVTDGELAGALEYALALYAMGADAVLVQDPGLAACIRQAMPLLPLHASTQLFIHHEAGVAWAQDHGFSRVVLARELPLAEITAPDAGFIREGIGLEVFIHGALCYSYSGQCLLSSVIGGRSGNRGVCAQPCRKPYRLVQGRMNKFGNAESTTSLPTNGEYLLSTKDLSVYPCLGQVLAVPFAALKIEGRMRSAEYVAIVTDVYRRAIDAIRDGTFAPSEDDMQDLALAFNRDFTTGYLAEESPGKVMDRQRPDNRGIALGVIRSWDPRRGEAVISPAKDLVPSVGDGIEILPRGGGPGSGCAIRSTPVRVPGGYRIPLGKPGSAGDIVRLTRSARLDARVRRILARRKERRTPIDLDLTLTADQRMVLAGKFSTFRGQRITVTCTTDFALTAGRSSPLTRETIRFQLARSGETPFSVRKFVIHYPGGLFAPLSALNRFRRDFFREAAAALRNAYRPAADDLARARGRMDSFITDLAEPVSAERCSSVPRLACYADTSAVARMAVTGGCSRIYFEPSFDLSRGSSTPGALLQMLEEGGGIAKSTGCDIFWKWPRVTRIPFLDAAVRALTDLHTAGITGVMVESCGLAELIHRVDPFLAITGGAGLNVTNHRTVEVFCPPLTGVVLSSELGGAEIRALAARVRSRQIPAELEVMVQGNLEAATSEDRLHRALTAGRTEPQPVQRFWGLRDGTGRIFPLSRDGAGRTRIANAVELCLVDHVPFLSQSGVGMFSIDARGRTPEYARDVAALYRKAVQMTAGAPEDRKTGMAGIKEELKVRSRGGITQGRFMKDLGGYG